MNIFITIIQYLVFALLLVLFAVFSFLARALFI